MVQAGTMLWDLFSGLLEKVSLGLKHLGKNV